MATVQNVALNTGLTHYARGIKFRGHIAADIFPDIIADHLTGSYWQFGEGDFRPETQGPFTLDAPYLEYEWDIDVETFEINNYGYVTRVSDLEQANAANQLQLPRKKLRRGMRWLTIQKELIARNVATRAGSEGFSGDHLIATASAQRWNNADVDPRQVIYQAKQLIGDKIGADGNAIIIPRNVATALSTNPKMREGFQYVREGPLTKQSIGLQFEIDPMNIFIGESIYNSAPKGKAKAMKRIWTDDVVVFYKEDAMEGDPAESAGFGGCFKLRGWEMTRVTETQIGNPPGMMYAIQYPYDIVGLNYEAGVLIQNAVSS